MQVLKYTLQQHGEAIVPLPSGARVLFVGDQQGAIQLWAEADLSQPLTSRRFSVIYTGLDRVPEGQYLGTVISSGGNIVSHVYETAGEG